MVYWALLGQVALPLALLVGLFVLSFNSRMLWLLTAVTTGIVLLLLAAIGMWIAPPWWMLWIYVAGWVVAIGFGIRRWSLMTLLPRGWPAWTTGILLLSLAGYSAYESVWAWRGRQPPSTSLMALAFPLRDGRYLVLNGGSDIRVNSHLKTRDQPEPRFARWRGNGYAVDIVAIDHWGLRARGLRPRDNRQYESFGRPVVSPCDGRVIRVVDSLADMTPPHYDSRERLAGNHVILECGGMHVVLAHFRQGSIAVREGASLTAGQHIAQVGNSGGTDEAHLHIHVQQPGSADAPMGGEPIPASYFGRFLVRGDRLSVSADRP